MRFVLKKKGEMIYSRSKENENYTENETLVQVSYAFSNLILVIIKFLSLQYINIVKYVSKEIYMELLTSDRKQMKCIIFI